MINNIQRQKLILLRFYDGYKELPWLNSLDYNLIFDY